MWALFKERTSIDRLTSDADKEPTALHTFRKQAKDRSTYKVTAGSSEASSRSRSGHASCPCRPFPHYCRRQLSKYHSQDSKRGIMVFGKGYDRNGRAIKASRFLMSKYNAGIRTRRIARRSYNLHEEV